jgi:hypothetical protein
MSFEWSYHHAMSSAPWKPSKPVAYLLGLLTVWTPLYFVLFIGFIVFSFETMMGKQGQSGGFEPFRYIFPLHALTMLLMFALAAAYIIHVFRNDRLASDRRIMWLLVILFGGIIAEPIYWWIYIRPGSPDAAPAPPPQPS